MRRLDSVTTLTPTDLVSHVACAHRTALRMREVGGERFPKWPADAHLELIRERGDKHEQAYLDELVAEHGEAAVDQLDVTRPRTEVELRADDDLTYAAMRRGAPVIFQPGFFDGRWQGRADFLLRVEEPSGLGEWSYEVLDTKLAREAKPGHLLQLCSYSEQVARLQDRFPHRAHVRLGDNHTETFELAEILPLYRRARARLETFVDRPDETYPEPVAHCDVCDFDRFCSQVRRADDHLSLVAGARSDQRVKLSAVGITTTGKLASVDPTIHDTGRLPEETFALRQTQAALQVASREVTPPLHAHRAPERARGYALLPAPDDGDLFFDLEGDPFAAEGGIEYLWGWEERDQEGMWEHKVLWAHALDTQHDAFMAFMHHIDERRRAHPGLHVYHYSPVEPASLKRLASEYASCEALLDTLLRERVFVDLYAVIRQGVQIGVESYSIKKLEACYWPGGRGTTIREGGGSIVAYETWLKTREATILDDIAAYNGDDCRSTRLLRDWAMGLRADAATKFGVDFDALRIPALDAERDDPEWVARVQTIIEQLEVDLPQDVKEDDADQAERRMLAWLLMYHRREALPAWWQFFALCAMQSDELVDQTDAIGLLVPDSERLPFPEKRSIAYPLCFPEQETRLDLGTVIDPSTGKSAGRIIEMDRAGSLVLVRGPKLADVPLPTALIATGPYFTTLQRGAIVRVAESVLKGGATTPGFAAVRAIVRRERPVIAGHRADAVIPFEAISDAERHGVGLKASYLAVQGPPGTGKTYTGAHMVIAAIAAGFRVGVTATSHKPIHNMLAQVEEIAAERGIALRGFHKCSEGDSEYDSDLGLIESRDDNDAPEDPEWNLVSGTAWLFAREQHDQKFDLLFIDEAGQMSLADAIAGGTSARSIVMLGDPQQLPQVTQGSHPGTSGCSVLEHLLDGEPTIPRDRGLFLERSWRMHPDICSYISERFYRGELSHEPRTADHAVTASGPLTGSGLRYVPIEHAGNTQWSAEEAAYIAQACTVLLADGHVRTWKRSGPLRPQDILVVAPYNLAVRELALAVPKGVRVGTVDKFQGQEAPIVFYAMTSSTAEDAPRGLSFLFMPNRLNVAVSRAQCLAVVVGSPSLLDARARTPTQMVWIAHACWVAELAERVMELDRLGS
jgi:predicted RecB family nuclease